MLHFSMYMSINIRDISCISPHPKRAKNTESDKSNVYILVVRHLIPSVRLLMCVSVQVQGKTRVDQKRVLIVPCVGAPVVFNLKLFDFIAVPSVMYLKPGTVFSQQNVECGLVARCRRGGGGVQLKQTGGHLHVCCRGLLSSNHESDSQEKSQKICSEIYDWRWEQILHMLHSESMSVILDSFNSLQYFL